MTAAETEKLADLLRRKLGELGGSRRHREDIVIEKVSDELDEVQMMGERELAIRNLDRDSKMLRQIRLALARIEDEAYGVCLHCEEPIAPKRMAALPWATFCIKCQEKMDRNEIENQEDFELVSQD
jgi:DnaK suppressor protein